MLRGAEVSGGNADHRRRIESAAEKVADRHVGACTQHHRLFEQPSHPEHTLVLVDDRGDDFWYVDGTIDLSVEIGPDAPLVAFTRLMPVQLPPPAPSCAGGDGLVTAND